MGQAGTQTDSVRKKSAISADIPLFTLQGNFDVKKLHGVYRLMMEIMVKTAGKGLAEKKDRTPEEDDMLDMMLHGGERVNAENLSAVMMMCPKCGKEMRNGYLFSSKDGAFSFANEVPSALENAKNTEEFVKLTGLKVGGRTSVEACCCDACRTIMIQY